MVLKILPNDVRSMLCASSQINNYKKAVEELVCNSLDAESTSIAIRINIQECRIQVVDNGNGINRNDFDVLGQRYMTSKLQDITTLRSIPKYYGYRGEFLANIIEISENVKITSRYKDGEDTWSKLFCKGAAVKFTEITTRPSKGTTVDIYGFLYNLNIQKQGINTVNDLQNIKSFLEQISLIHNAISLSLRDDSKNEIIFKIQKNRDIYQTLSTLFNIDKSMVQELHIEKSLYKIKGLIGKSETYIEKYWVFLNGKFINNGSKLHKTINGFLKKYFGKQNKKISKSKNNDENQLFKKHIPFYFIFIVCPYIDYDLSSTLGQPLLQFKNWYLIKIMLEKLVKFYFGDINFKEIKKPTNELVSKPVNHKDIHDNRDQIKKIIDKILGKNLKTSGPLPLQNGVKGEFIKRKKKNKSKQTKRSGIRLSITNQTNSLKENQDNNKHLKKTLNNRNEKVFLKLDTKNTNKGNNDINNDKQNSQNIMDSKKDTSNPSSKRNLPKRVKETFKIKEKNNKLKKVYKNISRKKIVHQQINYPKLLKSNCGISHVGEKVELVNNSEFIKKTKSIFHESEQMAEAEKVLKGIDSIQNAVRQKEYNFMNGINDYGQQNQRFENRCDFNLDSIQPKFRTKSFQTTYDLVNTVFGTQRDNNLVINFETTERRQNSIYYNKVKPSIELNRSQNFHFSNYVGTFSHKDQIPNINETVYNNVLQCNLRCEYSYSKNQFTNTQNTSKNLFKKPITKSSYSLKLDDIFENNSNIHFTQNVKTNSLSNDQSLTAVTYKSHNYNTNTLEKPNFINDQKQFPNKGQITKFITDESRDNFTNSNGHSKCVHKSHLKFKHQGGLQMFYKKNIKQNITVNRSYTVEYKNFRSTEKSNGRSCYVGSKTHYTHETHVLNYEPASSFGNTYTVSNHHSSCEYNIHKIYQPQYAKYKELLASNSVMEQNYNIYSNLSDEQSNRHKDNINFVFISDRQDHHDENVSQELLEPLDVCQTEYLINDSEKDLSNRINRNDTRCDNLYKNYNNQVINYDCIPYTSQITVLQNKDRDDVLHQFSNTLKERYPETIDEIGSKMTREQNINQNYNDISNNLIELRRTNKQNIPYNNIEWDNNNTVSHIPKNSFDLKGRLRFIPKGMSQIFDKCGTKTASEYNLEEEYYSNVLYNEFANDVQMQSEIYEPKIQNITEFSSKEINKFANKVHKENTSLSFDERSLKEAQIFNQVDLKFIAATIKEKHTASENPLEFLVLFDQHAVHERIRLEKNLTDYFIDGKWTSTALDNIKLKLSRDEIIYLHNYKDKFNLLGLQWNTVNDNEISLNSIPEAILGKNPREVDKVMKAVKNLIIEEVNIIKLQKGCISLYPKSIMDLVFSEACRYAIKFGDKLSNNDCIQLIKNLSNCKTPFQCAHGRPVMAVLFEIKSDMHAYKIDPASLRKFKLKI